VLDSAKVPQIGKMLFLCNPFASLMPAYRDVLINGTVPHLTPILLWFGVSLMLLQIGIILLRSQEKAVPKMI
jgi:lipopolysaccharide transport system permease protein